MPFCPSCGKETAPGAIYCASCGRPLQGTSSSPPYLQPSYYSRKEEFVAVILSLIIPGVGQMYAGRILRGIVIFITPTIFTFFIVIPILLGNFFSSFATTVTTPFQPPASQPPTFFFVLPIAFIVFGLLWLAFLVWNVFDAYNLAKTYNHYLMTTGRPPW